MSYVPVGIKETKKKKIYLQLWRVALIVPIPKPNMPKRDVSGFRPISLLTCISKTLAKIFAKRRMWYITGKI